jgi:hypothetical protein
VGNPESNPLDEDTEILVVHFPAALKTPMSCSLREGKSAITVITLVQAAKRKKRMKATQNQNNNTLAYETKVQIFNSCVHNGSAVLALSKAQPYSYSKRVPKCQTTEAL